MIGHRASISVALTMAIAAAACAAPPVLVLINRSGRNIAFLPGIVVDSCESVSLTQQQIDDAQREFGRWFAEEDDPYGWVPAGALQYTRGLIGKRIDSPDPMALVVSSEAAPAVSQGFIPEDLPACGGEPVGIS